MPVLGAAQDTYEIEKPLWTRALSGNVVDSNGSKIPDVLVELLSLDKQNVKGKVLTSANGSFGFSGKRKGRYLLRLTKEGWSPLYVTVGINKRAHKHLQLTMLIAR